MMVSKARLFGDGTALSAILASDDPREQKRLGHQVRHFDHDLWQTECKNTVLHGNLAKFSQNEEMRLALTRTGDRRLAEASPHDNMWGIGLSACDPRASSPNSWCGQTLLGQALDHAREILRRDTTAPLCKPAPEPPVPRDDIGDTVFEVDTVTHLRLDTDTPSANTQTATLSVFTDSVPDDPAPEVLLAQDQRIDAPLIPEQGPDLIGGLVTMDEATFTTLLSLNSGVSTTSRFNCRALLDTGSLQSLILLIKWSPRAPLTRPASDPRRPERGVVSDRGSCSAQTDRPEWPSSSTTMARRPRPLQFGCKLYLTRLCDASRSR